MITVKHSGELRPRVFLAVCFQVPQQENQQQETDWFGILRKSRNQDSTRQGLRAGKAGASVEVVECEHPGEQAQSLRRPPCLDSQIPHGFGTAK